MKANDTLIQCVTFPPMISSMGLWGVHDPFQYSLPALELQIIVVFALTQLLHFPLKRFRFPKLLSEIIAGILLGPTMPESIRKYTYKLFPLRTQGIIITMTVFGYTLFLFLIGVKSDVTMVKRTGKRAIAIGILSLTLPFAIGMAITSFLVNLLTNGKNEFSIQVVVAIQSLSPFPSIALLLKDLKIINSELGRLALSSAMISELLNVALLSAMSLYKVYAETNSLGRVILDLCLFICFVVVVVFIIRPVMLWVIKQTPEGRTVKNFFTYAIILTVLISCLFTHWVELSSLFGAFIIGLAVPDGPPLGSALVDRLDAFVSGMLVPIFVTIIASKVNLNTIFVENSTIVFVILVPTIALTKIAGCILPAWICRMPLDDAVALGLIMSAKGVVDMAAYSFARDAEIINEHSMALMVTSVAFAVGAVPILVRKFYNPSRKYAGYHRRNIMYSKHNSELRIVACIHKPDNIPGILNLLDTSGPTKQSPITICVLHLIELHGRSSPIFISHQLQKKTAFDQSYSENVIVAFNQYERDNHGAIFAQIFTAISPRILMHEDICNLALDRLAALIIIPFHRKWEIQGLVESEDHGLRILNCKILDRAPCSIGILVDRGHLGRKSSCSVAVIFLGGNDDREALAYAKRIARNSKISLTVIHCVSVEDEGSNKKEEMLDEVALKDVKINNIGHDQCIFYVVKVVKEGAETTKVVRPMVNEYDLIILGRRNNVEYTPQTSGLREWSEFPELGTIGDLLASMDGKSRASVLVIQQQQMIHTIAH